MLRLTVGNGETHIVPQSSPILTEQLSIFLKVIQKFPGATIELLAKESFTDGSDPLDTKSVEKKIDPLFRYLMVLDILSSTLIIGNNFRHFVQISEFFTGKDNYKIPICQMVASYKRAKNTFGIIKSSIQWRKHNR